MGLFDSIIVKCPECNKVIDFQSKGGECCMLDYSLEEAPEDVLSNANRHSPHKCRCGKWLYIDEENRKVKIWEKEPPPEIKGVNWFYSQEED